MRKKNDTLFDDVPREGSYGGFQYRWNYDEYQKSLQKKRRRAAGHGMKAFFMTMAFVFFMCFAALAAVLAVAFLREDAPHADAQTHLSPVKSNDYSFAGTEISGDSAEKTQADHTAEKNLSENETPETDLPEKNTSPTFSEPPQADDESTTASEPAKTEETFRIDNDGLLSGSGISHEIDVIPQNEPEERQDVILSDQSLILQRVAADCTPSTVTLLCSSADDPNGVGSGFFLSSDGYLVTNYHVVRKYQNYKAVLFGGTEYEAVLVGSSDTMDLAVLHIDADGVLPVVIGDSDAVMVGDPVVAIGTPLSMDFAGTVTGGNISGIRRKVDIVGEEKTVLRTLNMLQSTTVVNPGNSGGPLFNANGEVIGINTMKVANTMFEGMGLSIPITEVIDTLNEWIAADRLLRGIPDPAEVEAAEDETPVTPDETEDEPPKIPATLGVIGENVTESESVLYRVPCGVLVLSVEPDSNAALCGLRRNDILISADGTPLPDTDALAAWEKSVYAGDTHELTVFRDGEEIAVPVTFTAAEPKESVSDEPFPADETEEETVSPVQTEETESLPDAA